MIAYYACSIVAAASLAFVVSSARSAPVATWSRRTARSLERTVLVLGAWAAVAWLGGVSTEPQWAAVATTLLAAALPAAASCALLTAADLTRSPWFRRAGSRAALAAVPCLALIAGGLRASGLLGGQALVDASLQAATAYSYACLAGALALLARRAIRFWGTARDEALLLGCAIAVPWAVHALHLFAGLGGAFDPTPSAFLLTLPCVAATRWRDGHASLRQFALVRYFQDVEEPMLLIDEDDVIVEANAEARRLLRLSEEGHTALPLPERLRLGGAGGAHNGPDVEIPDEQGGVTRWFDVRRSPELAPTERGNIGVMVMRDITSRVDTERKLTRLANFDTLTGLSNRRAFLDGLERALEGARSNGHTLALLLVDVDRLKQTNDSWGHAAGDELLCAVAHGLREAVRQTDWVARLSDDEMAEPARLGGDEFAIVLPKVAAAEDAERVARRIRERVLESHRLGTGTVSIGIATFPTDGHEVDSLVRAADHALYAAKEAGGDGFRFFEVVLARKAERRALVENELQSALARNALDVHYQPKVELGTGRVLGFEALLRWRDPRLGIVSPDEFIDVAERTGLIEGVGYYVSERVCQDLVAWSEQGVQAPRVAINVATEELRNAKYTERLLWAHARLRRLPRALRTRNHRTVAADGRDRDCHHAG